MNPTHKFWLSFYDRDVKELTKYRTSDSLIDGYTLTSAAYIALLENDIKLFRSIDFYTRVILERVAGNPILLTRYIDALGIDATTMLFKHPLPSYVINKINNETRQIFNDYFKKHEMLLCTLDTDDYDDYDDETDKYVLE